MLVFLLILKHFCESCLCCIYKKKQHLYHIMSHTEKDLLLLKHWCHLMLTQKHLQQWMLTVTFKIIAYIPKMKHFLVNFINSINLDLYWQQHYQRLTTNYQVLQFQFILTINVILFCILMQYKWWHKITHTMNFSLPTFIVLHLM